jgi:hypothetical protein
MKDSRYEGFTLHIDGEFAVRSCTTIVSYETTEVGIKTPFSDSGYRN